MQCVTMPAVQPKVLAPGMYAIDVEPIRPRNRNNREVYLDYLKHLKESVETLREIIEEARIEKPLDNALGNACCSKHMTGNRSRLRNFVKKFFGTFRFGNDHFDAIMGYGDYVIDLEVEFRKQTCYVRNEDGVDLLKGSRGSNLYTIPVEDMMKSSPICLLSKASKNKSWLGHHRLNHLNFSAINDLARKDLLLRNSGGDSGPDLSFDKSASPERLFSSARVPFSFLPTFSIMAKKDMDLYHSRLTPDDLNDLIIKYKIPRDLHPRLPSEDFVMSELPDDAIGPLGLNKVITFEVLCRSLQIEPTVTLFRVFQTLCKQGDWFSFAKRRAPSPVCIDDNRSCMKHWKSGFFFIDRRAIPDAMVWRHPNAAIDDPRPAAGSFNMADVRRLSAHVIKLRDMPEGVLVLSGLSRVWKSRVCDPVLRGADGNVMGIHDFLCLPEWTGAEVQEEPHLDVRPTLQRLPFYCTPPAAADAVIPDPTLEDLAVGTPSSKIVAKAEASQKRKASTSGATSSHVAKRTRSALAQSSGSTTRPSLFVGDDDESDDDDDACVEIPLVTPLRSAAVIPSSGNQGGSSVAPAAEGSNTRDSRGKGVMVDDVAAPSASVSRPRPSSGPAPSFRDVSGDAIHMDFFPFSAGPYYATYLEDGAARNYEFTREEWDAPYRPTFGVLTKEVFKDPVVCKTIVDQFLTPGEMVRVESLSDD
ncbi:ribonuclease H-like domain-containing protein [Tanacetum coccineum]